MELTKTIVEDWEVVQMLEMGIALGKECKLLLFGEEKEFVEMELSESELKELVEGFLVGFLNGRDAMKIGECLETSEVANDL